MVYSDIRADCSSAELWGLIEAGEKAISDKSRIKTVKTSIKWIGLGKVVAAAGFESATPAL